MTTETAIEMVEALESDNLMGIDSLGKSADEVCSCLLDELKKARQQRDELIKLCNEFFIDYYVQEYSGANYTCLFCGATQESKIHGEYCPVTIYAKIKEATK